MFEYIEGKLVENQANYVVIDAQGIGYRILTPIASFAQPTNSQCRAYTSFIVRENSQQLYGFADQHSRNLFEVLINVSGVGPKTALCILSQFSADHFREAIAQENIPLISTVPGLGKKTAEKLVLDLRDKISKMSNLEPTAPKNHTQKNHDAISALVNLGFSEKNASKAIDKVTENGTKKLELAEMITLVLRSR